MTGNAVKFIQKLDVGEIRRELEALDTRRTILEKALRFAEEIRELAGVIEGDGTPQKRVLVVDRLHAWLVEHGPAMPRVIAEGVGCTPASAGTTMRKDPKRFKRTNAGWAVK